MKVNDLVTIMVKTEFGEVKVDFTVIAELVNYHYALLGQNRVVVGQQKIDNTWTLSNSVDLMKLLPIQGIHHTALI